MIDKEEYFMKLNPAIRDTIQRWREKNDPSWRRFWTFHAFVQKPGYWTVNVNIRRNGQVDEIMVTDDQSSTFIQGRELIVEPEVKEFVLAVLNNEYGIAADEYRRAQIESSRGITYHDLEAYKKRVEIAKKSLAYYGVYR